MFGGEGEIRTLAGITAVGALAMRWTPRSSFPLRSDGPGAWCCPRI